MDDDRDRASGQGVAEQRERCADELGTGRHAGRGVAPYVRQDVPAGAGEGLGGGEAEAAVGAEDEDGAPGCGDKGHEHLRGQAAGIAG